MIHKIIKQVEIEEQKLKEDVSDYRKFCNATLVSGVVVDLSKLTREELLRRMKFNSDMFTINKNLNTIVNNLHLLGAESIIVDFI